MGKVDAFYVSPISRDGSGDGSGDGYGYDDGSGYGAGSGAGSGYGSGDGYGAGSGYGDGYGSGDGSGYGYDDGSGYGAGSGYGDITILCGEKIYYIDSIPTFIDRVRGDVAKGRILDLSDFSISPCYIVRRNGYYAHGKTLTDARSDLETKLFEDMDVEERVAEFVSAHDLHTVYPNKDFFEWHARLTGSCRMGRESFARERQIDLDGSMTTAAFIELVQDSYGSDVIAELKQSYKFDCTSDFLERIKPITERLIDEIRKSQ